MAAPTRKRKGFFDDFFGNMFNDEFERIQDRMRENMERMVREAGKAGKEGGARVEGPHVWGFSMRIGPDGKPVINQFGNVPPRLKAREGQEAKAAEEMREPLVDVIEGKDETTVVAEVPGVEKKDIKLDASEYGLMIDVETKDRKYHKAISFKSPVKPETAKATYKNGVLEVRLDRKGPVKEKETRIKIE